MSENKLNYNLYLKEIESGTIKKPKTIKKFLNLLFRNDADAPLEANTLRNGIYAAIPFYTYSDKECKIIQTSNNKMRSYDDLYCLIKTYYPLATIKSVFLHLLKYNGGFKIIGGNMHVVYPTFSSCGTMKRVRLTYGYCYLGPINGELESVNIKYYTNNVLSLANIKGASTYSSAYSWKQLLELSGITTQEQLNKIQQQKLDEIQEYLSNRQ